MSTTKLMTADDLYSLPDDGWQYELIEGVLQRMPPSGGEHSSTGAGFVARLWFHVTSRRLGKIYGADGAFVLARDPDTVLVPDAAFVRADRLPSEAEQVKFLQLAPDLVVEVISPSNSAREIANKVRRYLDAGARLVWVVDRRRQTVTVHAADGSERVLRPGDDLDGGEVLPDFRVAVSEIFA